MNTEKNYFDLLIALTNDESLSKQLASELLESDSHSTDFFNKHMENYFSNRGITSPGNPEQTLCYLLDKLQENDLLYELDYKADSDELNHAIQLLSKGKIEEDLFSDEDEEDAEGMFELIFDAEEHLEEYDLAIVQFPLDSDSHPIAIVPLDRGEEIQTMIDELFDGE
jgi:hypothetical protein